MNDFKRFCGPRVINQRICERKEAVYQNHFDVQQSSEKPAHLKLFKDVKTRMSSDCTNIQNTKNKNGFISTDER